ncbi:MAG: branched-chain amino acid ABC transporter permease [Desulfatiglans sp.]|jgi:branched-chain amino acid transport system permease protein|nr:branched-chain amino acid ABC transporter permease [Thermodesulfobacteriota bacterium]MEE4353322.1 branched-chain amino acid ABC transporter permease [Desulfatiglans sp.]
MENRNPTNSRGKLQHTTNTFYLVSGWIVIGLVLVALPFFMEYTISQYYVYLAIKVIVWVLFAMSFNIVLGYGGMMSFGHAAFFGVGAYSSSLLLVKTSCPMVLAFVIAPFAAAAAGVIIGYFSVRVKGTFYFAVITLSFAQLAYILAFKWRSFTFGDDGIQGIEVPSIISTDETYINFYFFALIILLICLYLLWRIVRSPFGMMLMTLRENPERAAFVGIKVENYRLIAFTISAFFSGVAGVLYALLETSVAPDVLFWSMSGEVILMGVLGGMHIFMGPALGATIMVLLNSFITSYTEYWGLFLGITLILIVLFFPKGVTGLIVEQYGALKGRKKR